MLSAIFRKTIALPTAGGYAFFLIEHILYFKADNKDAILICIETDVCRVFKSLKELETSLSSCGFLRIRRDVLLNTINIKTVSKDGSIILTTGETVHPSREKAKAVEQYLKDYYYI
ncbi:MAG TPA: LytTR family DNA-binding domain-containing protein [Cytophagales bacterium]|nr:LytTR family DNA-binding domain-containing protein [Cytophagales bacterium]